MGGGPVDDEPHAEVGNGAMILAAPTQTLPSPTSISTHVSNTLIHEDTPTTVVTPPPSSSFPVKKETETLTTPEAPRAPINQQDLERPVLSTMAAGGLVGGIVGSMIGMGGVMGTATGAFIGASVASRDDALGAKVRKDALTLKSSVEAGVGKVLQRVNQDQFGRDVTQKVSAALQAVVETAEKHKVVDKVESAAGTVYKVAEPRVRTLYGKLLEKDKDQYIPKLCSALFAVDQATGFTRSVEAVKRELKM